MLNRYTMYLDTGIVNETGLCKLKDTYLTNQFYYDLLCYRILLAIFCIGTFFL